jgi:hypothetical protein
MNLLTLWWLGCAIFCLSLVALIVYIAWLHYQLREAIRLARPPTVLRDGTGRPLHERL